MHAGLLKCKGSFLTFILQKGLAKQDEVEHNLFNQVRQLESDRRKQEQQVLRLQEEIRETQRQNKALLKVTCPM